LFTDQLLDLIKGREKDGKPFFAYLAFTAPHFPLQAPKETIEKYMGRYDAGWDAIREQRFARLKQLGLISSDLELPGRVIDAPSWGSLSEQEQRKEAKIMAIYAAMVDNLDANVGRLIQHLKDSGAYDNSVIIFMSDNGTDPYDRSQRKIYRDFFAANDYDNNYENIGAENSYVFSGPGWAQVGSVHQGYYKFLPTQGGTRGPTIMRIPGILTAGETKEAFSSVADITPTLLDFAGVQHPGSEYQGRKVHAPRGRSMLPYLKGEAEHVYADDESVSFELFGHAAVFMGPWKAVRIRAPWKDNMWSLYNIENDPGEQNDLSKVEAERLAMMLEAYAQYEKENNVVSEPAGVTAYPNRPTYLKPVLSVEADLENK
jgi:arylsulfatase